MQACAAAHTLPVGFARSKWRNGVHMAFLYHRRSFRHSSQHRALCHEALMKLLEKEFATLTIKA